MTRKMSTSVVFGNVTNYPTVIQKRDSINLCVRLIVYILLNHNSVMNIQKYKLSHSNISKIANISRKIM